MKETLEKMKIALSEISSKQFEELFNNYFNDNAYISYFKRQYNSIYKNALSIDSLLKIGNIEDAFSIFRKYIETYILMNSILVNPNIADRFLLHEKYLSYKATNQNNYELRNFYKDKPDGYLQYGFIESLVEIKDEDYKYTIKEVASVGNIAEYYEWYRLSNNFVHNNTTGLKVDVCDGTRKIKELVKVSSDRFINKLKEIIIRLS
ncbi:MAG: DUF5677 domain-containing protein [Anaeroplasmataceae bacterium]